MNRNKEYFFTHIETMLKLLQPNLDVVWFGCAHKQLQSKKNRDTEEI